MPNLGFSELILIFIIALLVFGPKKLPELGKSLGKGLKEFRKATEDLKSNWDEHIKDVERSVDDVKSTVHEATRDIPDLKADLYSAASPSYPPSPAEPPAPEKPDQTTSEESKKEVHQA